MTNLEYAILIQGYAPAKFEKLERLHDNLIHSENNFTNILEVFVEENRENRTITSKPYIENLVSNIRQIIYSFSIFKEAKDHLPSEKNSQGIYYMDIESAATIVFFFNAKSFIEIVHNHTKYPRKVMFAQMRKDITKVRDHLAHAYSKDTDIEIYPKAIVTNVVQRGLSLEAVALIDIRYGIPLGTLYFSVDIFYFYLRDVFLKLKTNPTLFKL